MGSFRILLLTSQRLRALRWENKISLVGGVGLDPAPPLRQARLAHIFSCQRTAMLKCRPIIQRSYLQTSPFAEQHAETQGFVSAGEP